MRYSSKSGFWAVAVLLSGAAAFGSACGGSGSSDRNPTAGAGATGVPGGGATGTAGGTVIVAGGGETSSTAGTSSGTGGTGAMACDPATTCCKTAVCVCPYPAGDAANTMIDDLEDGAVKGWKTATLTTNGYWDFSNDATGMVTPANTAGLMAAAPGANNTTKSLHVTGTGHTGWGAALAAELSNGCPFDGSKYGGISFWAKGTSSVFEGTNKLLVLVGMPEFIPVESGGFCENMATNPTCFARHRVLIDLTADWKQYTVAWADLAPPTYLANGPTFNPNRIRDIVFNASGPSSDPKLPPTSFDFYVDELKFVPVGTPSTVGGGAGSGAGGGSGTAGAAAAAGAGGAAAAAGAGGAAAGSGGMGG
jgi:hypothetical protein